MKYGSFNLRSLRRHQAMIARTVADLREGKNVQHLKPAELVEMIAGLEERLHALTTTVHEYSEANEPIDIPIEVRIVGRDGPEIGSTAKGGPR